MTEDALARRRTEGLCATPLEGRMITMGGTPLNERLLVIGNKRYSSWSLRGWLPLKISGVTFEERLVDLAKADMKQEIRKFNPAERVPVLVEGSLTIHDSLAIGEYINEVYAQGQLLPAEKDQRARARSVCAEMHAGFPSLREELPMDLGRNPNPVDNLSENCHREIDRILSLWQQLRQEHHGQGHYLFGAWSLADAALTPVAARFFHYAIPMGHVPLAEAYCHQTLHLPAFIEWRTAALSEPVYPQFGR